MKETEKQLLKSAEFALDVLCNLTTEEFGRGQDHGARAKLLEAIEATKTHEATRSETDCIMEKLATLPISGIQALTDDVPRDEREEIADRLRDEACRMLRQAVYLEERHGYQRGDQGHAEAVKAQNRVLQNVRRALGFQNTVDIDF